MTDQTNNKTIAKNTAFLYFRMLFTMIVALFTSRVILQKLGIDDYGIYQAVGGIVGFLAFVNNALATGSSRFITYALGEGNMEKLKKTFSTTLNVHILMAILVALLAETAGLWYMYHKMVIPAERMSAAFVAFHLSIVTAVISMTQVPYNAAIIAHEKMSVFALMSIYEVCAKLGICYLLSIGNWDRLVLYSVLMLVVQCSTLLFYRFYCIRKFEEAHFSLSFDRKIFREIAGFSGWSLFAGGAIALNNQGILLLLNRFFAPAVVTARSISLQVNNAANQFVSNFRQAVNPQIVKKYAAGDIDGSKQLLLSSTRYSFYMMFMLSLPICILAEPPLDFWLDEVPDYAVPFLQIVIVQSLFQVFDTSFYTAVYAKGRLRENALSAPTIAFLIFPITYIFFKLGYSPIVLSWTSLAVYAILGLVQKPVILNRICGYGWGEIIRVFGQCLAVVAVSVPVPLILACKLDISTLANFIVTGFVCVICVALAVWTVGLDKETRKQVSAFLRRRKTI